MTQHEPAPSPPSPAARLACAAAAVGVAALTGAALALWASEGSGVFLEQAFAAVVACF
ncbi:hypothetical protein [Methylopila turkensis]|uniref:hypothetical protein n=1 Tax=Methylopila turkensis TaxID=1437816 RepID=UPI0022F2C421|nr:hypothetical protein [Methylopila turkensis]